MIRPPRSVRELFSENPRGVKPARVKFTGQWAGVAIYSVTLRFHLQCQITGNALQTKDTGRIAFFRLQNRCSLNGKTCGTDILTLARKPCFATFAGVGGGGWCDPPPWRFQTKRRRASRKRPADCSRRVLAIGGIIFGPRSIFDPVMAGQMSNFRKFHYFSTSRVVGIKTIYCSGMKPSPACSPFNSA